MTFQVLLRELGFESVPEVGEALCNPHLELRDSSGVTGFARILADRVSRTTHGLVVPEDILAYDANLAELTEQIFARRKSEPRWKYYQYLCYVLVEVFLESLFGDPSKLLQKMNAELEAADQWGFQTEATVQSSDLFHFAIWSATGSGKTLLLHLNHLQISRRLRQSNRIRLDRTLVLTPNERLAVQHQRELTLSSIPAAVFEKDGQDLWSRSQVTIIDIHKLREEGKQKTVSVAAFGSRNLLLVDEGHRGATGEEWRRLRDRLCEDGLSVEYSATFGQAAGAKKEIADEYSKSIIFDYSYKHFHRDGFGKSFRVLNLAGEAEDFHRRKYLVACLLAFYQQLRLYGDQLPRLAPYGVEKPLLVFVGSRVLKATRGRDVSDVQAILRFLSTAIANRAETTATIDSLLRGGGGLHSPTGADLFADSFPYLRDLELTAEEIYEDLLGRVFNTLSPGKLHVEELVGADGELLLRIGESPPFGVVSIGDASKFLKLCSADEALVTSRRLFAGSLFDTINECGSTVNALVGSKRFTEGWNSWRVATMGFVNIGRTEGSEAIQLFGRGVRLKGLGGVLKRSAYVVGPQHPKHLELLECLNVFGLRSDYMEQFEKFLRIEGIAPPATRTSQIPVKLSFPDAGLKLPRLPNGKSFRTSGPVEARRPWPEELEKLRVTLDCTTRLEVRSGLDQGGQATVTPQALRVFSWQQTAFLDREQLRIRLLAYKSERGFSNLKISRAFVQEMLDSTGWYQLRIAAADLEVTTFQAVKRWQGIAERLFKTYVERLFRHLRAAWEEENLSFVFLDEADGNFDFIREFGGYQVTVEKGAAHVFETLNAVHPDPSGDSPLEFVRSYDWHCYSPLITEVGLPAEAQVTPVPLNEGEARFLSDLEEFVEGGADGYQVFALRNQGRGHGCGIFSAEAGEFYPDFVLWLLRDGVQHVVFVDPKGIIRLYEPSHPKVQAHRTVKQLEHRLDAPNITLDSFIVSVTPFEEVQNWNMSKQQLEEHHILFMEDSDYIRRIVQRITRTARDA